MSWIFPCGINTEQHSSDELWPDCSLEAMNCAGMDETERKIVQERHERHELQRLSSHRGSSRKLYEDRTGSSSSSFVSRQRTEGRSDRSAADRYSARSELLDKENAVNGTTQSPPAPGVPITVPGKYSLQEAIQIGQKHGNTIVISSGIHRLRQEVVIDGNVRIVGESETTIHGSFVCAQGSSGMLSGLQIVAGSTDQNGSAAVVIGSGTWTLRDCVVLGSGRGNDALQIGGDARVTLQGCALGCNGTDTFESVGGAALWINGFATVKVSECTMLGMERGAFVHGCSNVDFKFSTFSENDEALVLRDRTVAIVKRCSFVSNARASFAVAEESEKLSTQRCTLIASDNKFEKSPEWDSERRPWKVLNATEERDVFSRAPSPRLMRSSSTEGFARIGSFANRTASHGLMRSVSSEHEFGGQSSAPPKQRLYSRSPRVTPRKISSAGSTPRSSAQLARLSSARAS